MFSFGIGLNVKNSKEAVELYCKAFGLKLGYHVLNEDGSYFHLELMEGDREALAVVEVSDDSPEPIGSPVELGRIFSSREELLSAFNLLKEDGHVRLDICELPWSPCAASVTDKFGVNWYLSLPQHRPPDDFKPAN